MSYISLREVQRRTGISRPSLIKYAREHAGKLERYAATTFGGRLVYSEAAIPVFQMLRARGVGKRGKKV